MKKLLMFTALAAALFSISTSIAAQKPELHFNKKGEFKIVQLTDLHFVSTRQHDIEKTFARMNFIISVEKPDFIAVTGDVVTGKPAREMLGQIVERLDSYKIPYSIVFGNHDAEQEMSRAEMSRIISSGEYCISSLNEEGELADIRIPVKPRHSGSPLDIYMFDSNDYPKIDGIGGYGWFSNDQIQWLRKSCEEATAENGGQHVRSFAFFHIPFPEFYDAWILAQEKRHNGVTGVRGEYGGHPRVNSGMFAAMLETGNIEGVFCGHDHDSDYIIPYYGIALVYGRFSGDDTTYNHLAHGTRVIIVKEKEPGFRTYIHEDDGRIQYDVHFANGKLD